jgi:hypothetical protein
MKQVSENVYVGNLDDYRNVAQDSSFVFVLACKYPCHKVVVGYDKDISPNHPEYISAIRSNGIAINMIDAESPLMFNHQQFFDAIDFMESNSDKNIMTVCNQGQSRSPSIALLYLSRKKLIDNKNYEAAKRDFMKLYPDYLPNMGIKGFLSINWKVYQ